MGIYEERRGRPIQSNIDYTNLNSIVLIADKYDLDPKQLIEAFFEASENELSQCGSLRILCRKINQDYATFLITQEEKVIWQFPVNLESIRDPYVRDYIIKIPMPEKIKKIMELGRNLKIGELRFGMKGVNVTAKIIEIPPTREVITKWGSQAFVSAVKMVDETGSIRLSLWNDQINTINTGDEVEIKNCNVAQFANNPQLKLVKKSTMSIIKQTIIVSNSGVKSIN